MSTENVEFVRGLFAAAAGMDARALVAALPELLPQFAQPDIEWIEDPSRLDAQVHRGYDGVLASWTHWLEQWSEYDFELESVSDCGDDVLMVARETARGATGGVPVSSRIFVVLTMRDGKVARWREFYEEADARAAAGIGT